MKTAVLRAAVLSSLAAFMAAGAGGVAAADDLIGGTLTVGPEVVIIKSTSTIPVTVHLSTDGPFSLEDTDFELEAGATRETKVVGDAAGSVTALLTALHPTSVAGDRGTVTLTAHFNRPLPPPDYTLAILAALAATIGVIAVLRRVRPWEFRVARSPKGGPSM